ncbi:MAG: thymidylate kinase [Phycisphaerales bacterium]|nr:thymidylate kinase [Phycisphaerales bacterium]
MASSLFEQYADLGPLPGKLFVVEGIDGSGKSTQMDLLRKWLVSRGYCVYFSEWNSSPVVRETTKFGKANRLLSPLTFSLIHAADFADRLARAILPPLRAGAIVLADRYIYTAFARDVARGIDPEYVRRVYRLAPKPTVAFYFNVPLQEALNRILSGRPELKWYEAGMDLGLSDDPYKSFELFQGRILDQYDQMTREFKLSVIDATQPIAEQQAQMRALVSPHLEGALRVPTNPYGDVLVRESLGGRYLERAGRADDGHE